MIEEQFASGFDFAASLELALVLEFTHLARNFTILRGIINCYVSPGMSRVHYFTIFLSPAKIQQGQGTIFDSPQVLPREKKLPQRRPFIWYRLHLLSYFEF